MTKRKPLHWWVVPGIITASLAALGGLGTLAVNYATFATLPQRVEAGEAANKQQDESISKLTAIQETWQDIYQQIQQAPNQPVERPAQSPIREWSDTDQTFWCCDTARPMCWEQQTWYRCR